MEWLQQSCISYWQRKQSARCVSITQTAQLFIETKLIKTQGESDKPYQGRETVQRGLKAEPQWTKMQ